MVLQDLIQDGFNPCFSGTRARTLLTGTNVNDEDSFNPCFSGTRARTRATVIWKGRGSEFQSLFFWNSRPDDYIAPGAKLYHRSFNPCFSGTRARTMMLNRNTVRRVSFNPCFSGTRARTLGDLLQHPAGAVSILFFLELAPGHRRGERSRRRGRVSILVFLELAPGRRRKLARHDTSIVSILVFLELAPGREVFTRRVTSIVEFQSLFFWNSRPDWVGLALLELLSGVSILVFLELAPGLPAPSGSGFDPIVSILVFLELAPGR